MTKNKAHKQAARERAAATGERYVVARRAIEREPELAPAAADIHDGVLHRLTHRVPGVPEHVEGGLVGRPNRRLQNPARPNRPHRPSARLRPRHGEPRVLVAWQHRIARLLGAE